MRASRIRERLLGIPLPVDGVAVDGATVVVSYAREITPAEKSAEAAAIAAEPESVELDAAYTLNRNPERKALIDAAQQAVADNNTFLAIGTPSNAQVLAQVRALTRQSNQLIRRLVQL